MLSAIQTDHLTKVYNANRKKTINGLDDVTLDVRQGEIFALLGANGAGKTTLIKILLGLTYPTSGTASILGFSISDPNARAGVGYLAERAFLPQRLTLTELLRWAGRISGIPKSLVSRRIDELIELVGLREFESMPLKKYSKGMLRLAGFAQSLVNNPTILILDEPSDGLDPKARAGLRQTLKRLRDEGATILLSSHVLMEVETMADRAAILKKGRLIKTGSISELTVSGDRFAVTIRGLPDGDVRWQPSSYPFTVRDGLTTFEARSSTELNSLLDMLRSAGLEIVRLGPMASTLEDSFLAITGDGEIV